MWGWFWSTDWPRGCNLRIPQNEPRSLTTACSPYALPVIADYVPYDPLKILGSTTNQSRTSFCNSKGKGRQRLKASAGDRHSGADGQVGGNCDAITDFGSSGKRIRLPRIRYEQEYYIASACDKIYLAPRRVVHPWPGRDISSSRSLDKLGIFPTSIDRKIQKRRRYLHSQR